MRGFTLCSLLLLLVVAGTGCGPKGKGGDGSQLQLTVVSAPAGDASHPTVDITGFVAGCTAGDEPWMVMEFDDAAEPPPSGFESYVEASLVDVNGFRIVIYGERYMGVPQTYVTVNGAEQALTHEIETSGKTRHFIVQAIDGMECPTGAHARSLYLATDTSTSEIDRAPGSGDADVTGSSIADPRDSSDRAAIDAALAAD